MNATVTHFSGGASEHIEIQNSRTKRTLYIIIGRTGTVGHSVW